jgi:AMMECR1 domain-containing protein
VFYCGAFFGAKMIMKDNYDKRWNEIRLNEAAELKSNITILEKLRNQDYDSAIKLLEMSVNGNISTLSINCSRQEKNNMIEQILEKAQQYRMHYQK